MMRERERERERERKRQNIKIRERSWLIEVPAINYISKLKAFIKITTFKPIAGKV